MNIYFKIFLVFVIIIGLNNCSSSNYFSLIPDEDISSIKMGREVVEKENTYAFSSLQFEEHSDNYFVFYLYINNIGKDDLIFDPNDVYFKAFDENKNPLQTPWVSNRVVDPEREIETINNEVKERKDSYDINTGMNIAYSIFNTILDLSDDEDNNAEEVVGNILIFTGNQIGEKISYDEDIQILRSRRDFWRNEALRKSILSKNEETGGLIFIPVNKEAKYIKIYIPIGKSKHTYKFKQAAID